MLKSRKKILLSSIAMLLVALVALGSATFAWYVSNAYVTGASTTAKASTADGLVIRKTTSDTWASSLTYTSAGTNQEYNPMSLDFTNSTITTGTLNGLWAAKGTSEAVGTYTEDGTPLANWEAIKAKGAYDTFYVATTKAGATQNVTVTISGSTVAGTYINVLVFAGGNLVASVNSTDKASATGRDKDGQDAGTLTHTKLSTASATFPVSATASSQGVAQDGTLIEVFAYVDGEDANCTTNTAKVDAFTTSFRFDKAA